MCGGEKKREKKLEKEKKETYGWKRSIEIREK